MISSSCIVLSSNYFIISLYDFRSVTLTLALFSHMTTWLYPRRTLGPILIPKYVVPFFGFYSSQEKSWWFSQNGEVFGPVWLCCKQIFCKEHVFLMILSKWGSVRAAVRVLQKCNRLWPLSKCSAVKTTFRHKSDEKGENEKFCPKTLVFRQNVLGQWGGRGERKIFYSMTIWNCDEHV